MSDFLHHKTPLIYSSKLTQLFGKGPVFLKLENLQVKIYQYNVSWKKTWVSNMGVPKLDGKSILQCPPDHG